jgi:hypothetical protein
MTDGARYAAVAGVVLLGLFLQWEFLAWLEYGGLHRAGW